MESHAPIRRPPSMKAAAVVVIFLFIHVVGCSSESGAGSTNATGDTLASRPSKQPMSDVSASSKQALEEPADASTPDAEVEPASPYRFEGQLPLDGTVRFKLSGGCSGCSGGKLSAKARARGSEVSIEGEVVGCEGPCEAFWPATGAVTLRGLRSREYEVRSIFEVTAVEAVTRNSSKRTKLALAILAQSCTVGLASLNGEERSSQSLVDAVGGCLTKVSPELKFETVSSMLTWDNSKAYVPVLIPALEDTKVAYLAARVLGRTEDRRATGPLIKALETEDESLRWDAARSLKRITKEDFGEDPDRWKRWHSSL